MFHRARQVAERGAGHLCNDLHATPSWDDNALRMVRRYCGIPRDATAPGLLLVPSTFAGHVLTWSRPPHLPQLAYPARGTGTLWGHRPVPRADAIAAVISRSRTVLLVELAAPAPTTEFAQRTGISAAGVSQHLTALRDAGMVTPTAPDGRSSMPARLSRNPCSPRGQTDVRRVGRTDGPRGTGFRVGQLWPGPAGPARAAGADPGAGTGHRGQLSMAGFRTCPGSGRLSS